MVGVLLGRTAENGVEVLLLRWDSSSVWADFPFKLRIKAETRIFDAVWCLNSAQLVVQQLHKLNPCHQSRIAANSHIFYLGSHVSGVCF